MMSLVPKFPHLLLLGACSTVVACGQGNVERCDESSELVGTRCETKCAEDERRAEDGTCEGPASIRVNTVGYFRIGPKVAVVTDAKGDKFEVQKLPSGEVVFEGELGESFTDEDSLLDVRWADFSELEKSGRYRLQVDGIDAPSPEFRIDNAPFDDALHTVMLGFYGLRCGAALDFEYGGERYRHAACHEEDGYESPDSDQHRNATGGWHDAGDYGKYTLNAAFSVGMMLLAWEHFPGLASLPAATADAEAGSLPPFLAELKYELDWLLTMQRDDGAAYHKLTALDFAGFVMPETDLSRRQMAEPSTAATASFSAVMAQAARTFAPYDAAFADRALAAAERAFDFLLAHPERIDSDPEGRFATGAYASDDPDDRLWAATELSLSTERDDAATMSADAIAAITEVEDDWDWSRVENLGLFQYALSEPREDDEGLHDTLRQRIVESAERIAENAESHGFQRGLGATYYWGANGLVARSVINLSVAYQITGEARFERAGLAQLNHLLGVNVFSRSLVTGLGHYPPEQPHHRPSGADSVKAPWPGLLVGGPNNQRNGVMITDRAAFAWVDQQGDYWSNEVAINWNAALAYALAWSYQGDAE